MYTNPLHYELHFCKWTKFVGMHDPVALTFLRKYTEYDCQAYDLPPMFAHQFVDAL